MTFHLKINLIQKQIEGIVTPIDQIFLETTLGQVIILEAHKAPLELLVEVVLLLAQEGQKVDVIINIYTYNIYEEKHNFCNSNTPNSILFKSTNKSRRTKP